MSYIPKSCNGISGMTDEQIRLFYSLSQSTDYEGMKEYKTRIGNRIEDYFNTTGMSFSKAKNPKNARATKKKEIMKIVLESRSADKDGYIPRAPTFELFAMWCHMSIYKNINIQQRKTIEYLKKGENLETHVKTITVENHIDYKEQCNDYKNELLKMTKKYDNEKSKNKKKRAETPERPKTPPAEKPPPPKVKEVVKEVVKECDSTAKLRMNNAKKMMKNKCFTDLSMTMGLDGIMGYISECEKDKQQDILEHTDNWIHEILKLTPSQEIKDILLDMYKKKSACFT
tara:strand:+ start:1304 stop:2161 length:858 start_codon:yes stop_codon:yes gene_type:complete